GLGALALHNAADFSWETGGVALAGCAIAALATGARAKFSSRAALACAALTALAIAAAASPLGRPARRADAALAAAAPAPRPAAADSALLAGATPSATVALALAAQLAAARRWHAMALVARRGLDLDADDLALRQYFVRAALETRELDGLPAELERLAAGAP